MEFFGREMNAKSIPLGFRTIEKKLIYMIKYFASFLFAQHCSDCPLTIKTLLNLKAPETFHMYSDSIYLQVMDIHGTIIARGIRQFPSVSICPILQGMTV